MRPTPIPSVTRNRFRSHESHDHAHQVELVPVALHRARFGRARFRIRSSRGFTAAVPDHEHGPHQQGGFPVLTIFPKISTAKPPPPRRLSSFSDHHTTERTHPELHNLPRPQHHVKRGTRNPRPASPVSAEPTSQVHDIAGTCSGTRRQVTGSSPGLSPGCRHRVIVTRSLDNDGMALSWSSSRTS